MEVILSWPGGTGSVLVGGWAHQVQPGSMGTLVKGSGRVPGDTGCDD